MQIHAIAIAYYINNVMCQRNEDQSIADAMAKSMRNHDMKSFWKDVSSTYSRRNVPLATTVNGASDPTAICDTS